MRIMPDYNFTEITSITANSANPLFPAFNLLDLDPGVIWRAASFSVAVTLVFDLSTAKDINKIWLNNANFTNLSIQANSSNSWTSPAVNKSVVLGENAIGTLCGYFAFSETKYRYVRILIPVQTLAFGAAPQLGNVILGKDLDFSPVSDFHSEIVDEKYTFFSDSGRYFKKQKYKPRHVFTLVFDNITKQEALDLPLSNWENAVFFTDLGAVAESYLVYSPEGVKSNVRHSQNCSVGFDLEELV
jgi:hypothetical protein